jgi:glycosyltransferase involved in cell wall biosynthesis
MNSQPPGNPRISFIVATRNAGGTLQACIDSIRNQMFRDWELIVVDGASSDTTVEILRRNAASIAYWHSRPDGGIYDAWNQALQHARGSYVCFIGADDALHAPDSLQRMVDAIGAGEFDLVTARGLLIRPGVAKPYAFGGAWDYRKVARRMTICHPGTLHRRALFDRFGRFDTGYRIGADYDFLLRLPPDLRSLHLDFPVVDVADGGLSRSRRLAMLRERFRAQAHCRRVGRLRAAFNFADKLWRLPVARLLRIPN